jgi:hypothetical protein
VLQERFDDQSVTLRITKESNGDLNVGPGFVADFTLLTSDLGPSGVSGKYSRCQLIYAIRSSVQL